MMSQGMMGYGGGMTGGYYGMNQPMMPTYGGMMVCVCLSVCMRVCMCMCVCACVHALVLYDQTLLMHPDCMYVIFHCACQYFVYTCRLLWIIFFILCQMQPGMSTGGMGTNWNQPNMMQQQQQQQPQFSTPQDPFGPITASQQPLF